MSTARTTRKKRRTTAEIIEAAKAEPKRAARIARHKKRYEAMLALEELRRTHQITQKQLARLLDVSQERVSQIERQADARISTVREYVAALGGDLELVAVFDDERIPLKMG